MDDKLRVGIIGVGTIAAAMHVPGLKATGRAEVVAVCRRTERLLAIAKEKMGADEAYTDWREMLDKAELDAVVVSTPHNLHTEPVIAALEHGLHVLVDKPMALKSVDAWSIVEAAQRAERVLMVAYNGRLTAKSRAVKMTLDQGRLGHIRQIVNTGASYYNYWYKARVVPEGNQKNMVKAYSGMPDEFFNNWVVPEGYWRGDVTQSGGGLFVDGGTHSVDMVLWLGGAPAIEVVSFMDKGMSDRDRYVSAQARLANGVLVTLSASDTDANYDYHKMTIIGDDGALTMDEKGIWLETAGKREEVQPVGPEMVPPAFPFVSCILDGAPNPIPGEAGAHAVAFVEAAYRSAAEKKVIQLA